MIFEKDNYFHGKNSMASLLRLALIFG